MCLPGKSNEALIVLISFSDWMDSYGLQLTHAGRPVGAVFLGLSLFLGTLHK